MQSHQTLHNGVIPQRDIVGHSQPLTELLLTEYGIAWANWDYKGGIALAGNGKSTGIAENLLG